MSGFLNHVCTETGGNRPTTAAIGTRLLQVACGGTMVVTTYDVMKFGKTTAEHTLTSRYRRLNTTISEVNSTINGCKPNLSENINCKEDKTKCLNSDAHDRHRIVSLHYHTFFLSLYTSFNRLTWSTDITLLR